MYSHHNSNSLNKFARFHISGFLLFKFVSVALVCVCVWGGGGGGGAIHNN